MDPTTLQTELQNLFPAFEWNGVTLTDSGGGLSPAFPSEYGYAANRLAFTNSRHVVATVKYTGNDPGIISLLGKGALGVSGAVDEDAATQKLFRFELCSSTTLTNKIASGGFGLPAALCFVGVVLEVPATVQQPTIQTYPLSFVALKGDLELPSGSRTDIAIPFYLIILSDPPGQVTITCPCNATLTLQEVAALLGAKSLAEEWGAELPNFPATLGLTLTEVTLRVDVTNLKLITASATVRCADGWKPFASSAFTFDAIEITFFVLGGGVALSTSLAAQATIAGIEIDAQVIVPELSFYGKLGLGSQAPLRPLLDLFHLDGLGLDGAVITELEVDGTLDPASVRFLFTIEDALTVKMGGVEFDLSELEIQFTHEGKPANSTTASLRALFEINSQITLDLTADYGGPDSGWDLSAQTAQTDDLGGKTLQDIAQAVAKKFGVKNLTLPSPIGGCTVTSLAMTLNTRTKAATARLEALWNISDSTTASALSLDIAFSPATVPQKGYDFTFEGQVTLAGREFDLIFDKSSGEASVLLCSYSNPAGDTVTLSDLIKAATSANGPDGADKISFTLKDGLLAMQFSPPVYLLALDLDMGVDLSGLGSLPLIGQALGGKDALALSFQILAGTMKGKTTLDKVAGLLPAGAPNVPDTFTGPFQLITTLKLGGESQTIALGGEQNDPKNVKGDIGTPATQPPGSNNVADPAAKVAGNANVKWITLQKHFGPLSISRIGVGYSNAILDVLLDASFAIGPLSLALEGLGAEYNTSSKALSFTLRGGALAFEKGALSLSAAFLRMPNDDLAGLGTLRFNELGITVMGAIGEVQGHPSFFIYAAIDYPLGGPAFFFVEGLALGFGVNRRLLMPAIADVSTFPFVAAALGNVPMPTVGSKPGKDDMATVIENELLTLEKYVPPMLGEYFFAVGVKFTSFKLIRAFALLAMSVGKEFELDIIGVATVTHPPIEDLPAGAPVMVKVDLGIMVRFVPAEGLLAVDAQLMADSFLYDPACHLVGGFAYYSWFSGEHAGDFVTTLGGYHPQFTPPAHYPQSVPRLGFNWQVTPQVLIKGGAYFALTPHAAMAGGFLSATYNSDDISAWFTCSADFLMYWKPFHYQASATVEIGAAVTVHCFGTHHVTISAGAELDIWGPHFAGRAHVHVKVLIVQVHFTVNFGDSSQNAPPKLNWTDFQKAFLPADVNKVCSVSIARGLVRTVPNSDALESSSSWIINPKELVLVIDSLVPSSGVCSLDKTKCTTEHDFNWKPIPVVTPLPPGLKPCGIEPMGTAPDKLTSNLVIRVRKQESETVWKNVSDEFNAVPIVKKMPRALWSEDASATSSPGLNDKQTADALTGYELHPKTAPKPGVSCFIQDSALAYDVTVPAVADEHEFSFVPKYTMESLPQGGNSESPVAAALQNVTANRDSILDDFGFLPVQDVALDETLASVFVISPAIATFGEAL